MSGGSWVSSNHFIIQYKDTTPNNEDKYYYMDGTDKQSLSDFVQGHNISIGWILYHF